MVHFSQTEFSVLILLIFAHIALRGVSPHSLYVSILIPFPIFVEKPYNTPFIDSQRVTLESTMYIKAYFLNQCHTTELIN